MKHNCPEFSAPSPAHPSLIAGLVIRKGFFFRKSDSRRIRRYYCKVCKKSFSKASLLASRYQKKRRINALIRELYCSGVSQRRAARILRVNRKTAVRRFKFLANVARIDQAKFMRSLPPQSLLSLEFDDLETSEHTKCKPLSVALAVQPKTRKILGFAVSPMPAKGRLAVISIKKYGVRRDQRSTGWNQLLDDLKPILHPGAVITSDENPHYPRFLKRHFPEVRHIQIPGGRGAITGQGELKKKRFDPIFSLNHTCAMLRANLNRLFRRTWCTTKTRQGLIDHLSIYIHYHNQHLTRPCPLSGAS